MADIVDRDIPIVREVWSRDDVAAYFKEKGESFKAEWVVELPEGDEITMYRQGDWIDLCRGPHLPKTGRMGKAFKLMKLAGAYWRGDASNPQLQRIYGTCWRNEKELKAYLTRIEEAEKRDHRRLGRELDLFHIQEEARGSVFWHPKGWSLYRTCENYMRMRLDDAGYVEVKTPQLVDRALWERSGHWDKFRDHMFIAEVDESSKATEGDDGEEQSVSSPEEDAIRHLALKPMNCPCHVQIFRHGMKSYRDLPLRMAEFGSCHRYEAVGCPTWIDARPRIYSGTMPISSVPKIKSKVKLRFSSICSRLFIGTLGLRNLSSSFQTAQTSVLVPTKLGIKPRRPSKKLH